MGFHFRPRHGQHGGSRKSPGLPVFLIGGDTEYRADMQTRSHGLLQHQSAFAYQEAFPGVVAVPEVGEEGEGRRGIHRGRVTHIARNFEAQNQDQQQKSSDSPHGIIVIRVIVYYHISIIYIYSKYLLILIFRELYFS
jgi:hypothetical protein